MIELQINCSSVHLINYSRFDFVDTLFSDRFRCDVGPEVNCLDLDGLAG